MLVGSGLFAACLPGDTRPPPGSALVTVSADDAISNGISSAATEDGWAIHYQRFLLGIGRVSLDGPDCSTYADADYTRVIDVQAGSAQKVSQQFALGQCSFRFSVAAPSSESLLGTGVSDGDVMFLRTPGADPYAGTGGISIYVEGRAVRGEETKTFAWPFRWRVDYEDCSAEIAGQELSGLEFVGGEEQSVDLLVTGEALFQDDPDPGRAKLRFDPFAQADSLSGNADGEITLEELGQVKISDVQPSAGYGRLDSLSMRRRTLVQLGNPPTLEDYVYAVSFPAVVRFRGSGTCYLDLRERGSPD
jgi:hypothetical protein